MDFALSPAELEVVELSRRLAAGVLAEHADAVDAGLFPLVGLRAVAEAGLMTAKLPVERGGKDASNLAFCHVIHELAKVCASTAVTVSVTNMVADMIWKFGTPAQREQWLGPIARGDFPAAAFALSEPSAGSDAGSLRTRATKVADGWQLDGQKLWITSGDRAGVTLVMAKTDPAAGARGITAFLVPAGTPGFEIGRHEEKLGLRGSSTVGLAFQGCVVPDEAVLGGLGMGFTIAMTALDGGRCTIGAQALGMGYRALEASAKHLKSRAALDKAAGTDQPVQFRLADMAMRLDAGWLLVQRAAWLRDRGKPMTREAAMAKVNATEAAGFACQTALQLVGAAALDGSHPVARAWRDVRVSRIYEGTSEIQRLVIARSLVPAGRA
jgi:alkylation response protein AidB-like acyl-CoA dehydrogenase